MSFRIHQNKARQNTKKLIIFFTLSLFVIIFSIYSALKFSLGVQKHFSHYPRNRYSDNRSNRTEKIFQSIQCEKFLKKYKVASLSKPMSHYRYVSIGNGFFIDIDEVMNDPKLKTFCPQSILSEAEKLPEQTKQTKLSWWDDDLFWQVAFISMSIIGGISLFKLMVLRTGGAKVALEMGGTIVIAENANAPEKILLEIVENMAQDLKIPTPSVYVLRQEQGINAFAAGNTINNAVIGITQGALDTFDQDELKAVIGHEFSHIINGDMTMNINLSCMIYGLISIYLLGQISLRMSSRYSRNNSLYVLFGLFLIVIGALGMLCGNIIKSAISRQREFLADASSAEFTHNPEAMAFALIKIRDFMFGTSVNSPYVEAYSHMLFGSASNWDGNSLFDTHPPINQRIKRLQNMIVKVGRKNSSTRKSPSQANANINSSITSLTSNFNQQTSNSAHKNKTQILDWEEKLPLTIKNNLQNRESAVATIFALCLEKENFQIQQEYLQKQDIGVTFPEIIQTKLSLASLDTKLYIPVIEKIGLSLSTMEMVKIEELLEQLKQLAQINCDRNNDWSIKGLSIYLVLQHGLRSNTINNSDRHNTIQAIWTDCLNILSVLAHLGESNQNNIDLAFNSGAFLLPKTSEIKVPKEALDYNLTEFQNSLKNISQTTQKLKEKILYACVETIMSKGKIKDIEIFLLGSIAICLDCPLPSFITPK